MDAAEHARVSLPVAAFRFRGKGIAALAGQRKGDHKDRANSLQLKKDRSPPERASRAGPGALALAGRLW
jgi:hypothetical protein